MIRENMSTRKLISLRYIVLHFRENNKNQEQVQFLSFPLIKNIFALIQMVQFLEELIKKKFDLSATSPKWQL